MKQLTGEPKKRYYWLDVARVIAIISISCNHAVNRAFATEEGQLAEFLSVSPLTTAFKTAFYVFSRIGVPLFLMITGALILKKEINDGDGVKEFYKHNLLRLFITCEIWFFISYLFRACPLIFHGKINILQFFYGMGCTMLFINQTTLTSYWYLPMILCVYLLLPFACILKSRIRAGTLIPFAAVLLFTGFIVPTADTFVRTAGLNSMSVPDNAVLISKFFIFIVTGYLISRGYFSKIKKGLLICLSALSFTAVCLYQVYLFSVREDILAGYENVGILVCSVCLFELIRRGAGILKSFRRPVEYISRIAFGIYLVHIFIVISINDYLPGIKAALPQPAYFFFLEAVSVAGAVIIIAITSKIPFVKKYVYMIK